MAKFSEFIVLMAFSIASGLLGALVLLDVYNWFFLKTFSLPSINIWDSYAIFLVRSILFVGIRTYPKEKEKNTMSDAWGNLLGNIIQYLILWAIAAILV